MSVAAGTLVDRAQTGAGTLTQRHGVFNRNVGPESPVAAPLVAPDWGSGDGVSGATGATGYATRSQLIEPTTVPNIPALTVASGLPQKLRQFRNISQQSAYCFICGLALLAGVNLELLWARFTDIMYIPWSFVL